mmetsp:Transcript_115094/g.326495  ORF Transcript_115094/g.326495 Transcript_115094/m.326495 type:complete len:237 (-) Transcript_115094:349-1059(-)
MRRILQGGCHRRRHHGLPRAGERLRHGGLLQRGPHRAVLPSVQQAPQLQDVQVPQADPDVQRQVEALDRGRPEAPDLVLHGQAARARPLGRGSGRPGPGLVHLRVLPRPALRDNGPQNCDGVAAELQHVPAEAAYDVYQGAEETVQAPADLLRAVRLLCQPLGQGREPGSVHEYHHGVEALHYGVVGAVDGGLQHDLFGVGDLHAPLVDRAHDDLRDEGCRARTRRGGRSGISLSC